MRAALTIAGSDSGGGAGIQADLRTFAAHGLLGCTAVTAVTAQNTVGVRAVQALAPDLVVAQLAAVMDDLPVRAAKTGMLATRAIVEAVCGWWAARPDAPPLIVDPVMVATSGDRLVAPDAVAAVRDQLLPLATVVTPNRPEAAALLGLHELESVEDLERAARELVALCGGRGIVVVKGGHGDSDRSSDVLALPDGRTMWLHAPRIDTTCTHGTGCTLSAAITARVALGHDPTDAVRGAKRYLSGALAAATPVGRGHGPVDHLWQLREAIDRAVRA